MSSPDEAAMLALELPVSISVVRDMLELGYSAEQIRAEVTLKVAGLPVPETWDRIIVGGEVWPPYRRPGELFPLEPIMPPSALVVPDEIEPASPEQRLVIINAFRDVFNAHFSRPATIATHPELECWASRDQC